MDVVAGYLSLLVAALGPFAAAPAMCGAMPVRERVAVIGGANALRLVVADSSV